MKIDLKELGKRIKLTRKGQDLTQEMLAEKLVSVSIISMKSKLDVKPCLFIVLLLLLLH